MRNRDHKNTYGLLQLLVHQGVSIGFQSQVAGVKVWEQSADVNVIFLASSHGWEGTGKEKGKEMEKGGRGGGGRPGGWTVSKVLAWAAGLAPCWSTMANVVIYGSDIQRIERLFPL